MRTVCRLVKIFFKNGVRIVQKMVRTVDKYLKALLIITFWINQSLINYGDIMLNRSNKSVFPWAKTLLKSASFFYLIRASRRIKRLVSRFLPLIFRFNVSRYWFGCRSYTTSTAISNYFCLFCSIIGSYIIIAI